MNHNCVPGFHKRGESQFKLNKIALSKLAILAKQSFNSQFNKLSHTYYLVTPTRLDAQGVILMHSTT
jgi:hypothetical protein